MTGNVIQFQSFYFGNIVASEADRRIQLSESSRLWRAVVAQALIDLKNNGTGKLNNTVRQRANKWLSFDSKDFLLVCCYANFDPIVILQKAKEIRKKKTMGLIHNSREKLLKIKA